MTVPLRLLMIEDSRADAELALAELRRGGYQPDYERVDTPGAMKAALERGGWEIILSDYVMPGFSGAAALKMVQEMSLGIPFIMVTGQVGEETAVEAVKAGANDYVMKANLRRLVPAIQRELREAEVRRERKLAEEDRDRLLEELYEARAQLEARVAERTAELTAANRELQTEIVEHNKAEEELRENEERLRFALETSRMGAWDLDLVDHTAHRTLEHDRIFGYEQLLSQWTYEMFLDHVLPEDRPEVDAKFRGALATRSDWSFECRIRRVDGEVRWIWAAGRHRGDASDGARRMEGIVQDITERKLAEEELRRSENRLRTLIENVNAGVALIDETGRFSLYNREFLKMFGLAQGSDIKNVNDQDWSAWQVFDEKGQLLDVDQHPVRKAVLTRAAVRGEFVGVCLPQSRDTIWMLVSAEPVFDADGRMESIICTYGDITERKRIEAEREHLVKELEASNHELQSFSYSVSQDLRAPLRHMDGFSEILLERYAERLDEQGKQYLRFIREGSERMGHLIDDLLIISRVTQAEIHREKIDLSQLARAVAAELGEEQPEREVEFVVAPRAVANADPDLLRLVLRNLFENAWKFTSKKKRANIEFGVTESQGKPAYFVRDNGVGFDQAQAERLFEPFHHLHSREEFPGTGIGLATVQRIIRRHGGRVWAEGELDKGATFHFTLG